MQKADPYKSTSVKGFGDRGGCRLLRQNSPLALLGRPSETQEKAGRKNSHLDAISPREEIKLGRGEVAQPFYTGSVAIKVQL